MGDIRVAFGTKYGPIGIAGWVFGGIDLLVNVLHIPPVRRVLVMSELGQAIDFIVEHWTHPGWTGDPTTQIFVILACALVILWDGRRTHENSNAQQMITIGLVLIVLGAIAIGVGWWQLPSTSSSAVAVATPPPVQSEPSRPAIPKITYTERDIRELLDALSDADDLVSKKLMPVWSPLQNRLINPEYFLTQLGRKVTIQALNDSKDLLQKIVWPSINDFVYKEHNRY
jgi:hypothetical protein